MSDKQKKLEEDIAAFPYPVFGLRESVYDLEYVDHFEEEGRFTICYQSRSKPPYQFSDRSLWTVSIDSSLYVHKGPFLVIHGFCFPPYIEETIQVEETIQEEEEIETFVVGTLWKSDLDIDGMRFLGEMQHTEDPFNMASWCYSPDFHHYHIDGRTFGLSYEEVVGVLCALRKLK